MEPRFVSVADIPPCCTVEVDIHQTGDDDASLSTDARTLTLRSGEPIILDEDVLSFEPVFAEHLATGDGGHLITDTHDDPFPFSDT